MHQTMITKNEAAVLLILTSTISYVFGMWSGSLLALPYFLLAEVFAISIMWRLEMNRGKK